MSQPRRARLPRPFLQCFGPASDWESGDDHTSWSHITEHIFIASPRWDWQWKSDHTRYGGQWYLERWLDARQAWVCGVGPTPRACLAHFTANWITSCTREDYERTTRL